MSSPQQAMHCPPDETLAAFIDGRLEGDARERVEEHVATCDDCRSVWQSAADFEAAETPENVVTGRFGRGWVWGGALAAAIAAVFLLGPIRDQFRSTSAEELIAALNDAPDRPFEARLSAELTYKPKKKAMRGGAEESELAEYELDAAVAKVLSEKDADPRSRAVAQLIQKDWDGAVKTLESAVMEATGTRDAMAGVAISTDAALLNDLAIAYLMRRTDETLDLTAALKVSDRAWSLERTPVIAFNRALIVEKVRPAEAKAAWNEYLSLDSKSPWADEVRSKLARIG